MEIGCGTGYLLNSLKPRRGVGVDISPQMVAIAREQNKNLEFFNADAETIDLAEKFDYILVSDTLIYFTDLQKFFSNLNKVVNAETRIIITYHNFFWAPILKIAEILKLKMPQKKLNWLNTSDIINLLNLEGYEVVKKGNRFLMPINIPFISYLINRYLAPLPLINMLCLNGHIIARKINDSGELKPLTVSVIIPARNEKGNIEEAVIRTPQMGAHTEIIFVEGGSADDTWEEIKRISQKYQNKVNIKFFQQEGRGKGDAVRKGFAVATGDILMILDADLTVPPEDLSKFYKAIANGKGEFINGSRLVYPTEREAMRYLNMLGNKFFSLAFTWLLGQRLKDTLCGTKVLSRGNYEKIKNNRQYFGEFDPFGDFDLIFGAAKSNLKIVEIPIRYQARKYGETNISRFRHGWLLLKMVFFAMNKIKFV